MVLHDKTPVFITTESVGEVEGGSTFHETCLTAEVQKGFMKPAMLHGPKPAEICFVAPLVSAKCFNV